MSVVIYSFNVTQSCTNKITQNTSIIELWTNINVSIEVVDDNGVSSIVNLISILNSQANLLPQVPGTFSFDTTVNEGGSNVILLSYATRIECATNYYQSDCSVYCIPTNNNTGHHNCDNNSNKVCLPGFTNADRKIVDFVQTFE